MELIFTAFASFTWLLKFLSYFGFLAGIGTAIMFLAGGFSGTKNFNPQKSNQGFGLFFLGVWTIIALVLVLGKSTMGIIIGQVTFAGFSGYLLFWDSRKEKAKGRSGLMSLVVGTLLLTQPLYALWVLVCKM